jgi:arginine-tRNA-protein transferase
MVRLEASALKPAKDQRQALNRWSRYVLGDVYIREAAIRYPKTKEYDCPTMEHLAWLWMLRSIRLALSWLSDD